MEQRPLGDTGIWVSELCLGAMMFGAFGNQDHEECAGIVHRALDAGINFFNTADGYSAGESEQILGEALADGRRDEAVLSVKFGLVTDGNSNHGGGSRRWISRAVEGSLRRLRTDYIDVYELGVPDETTDLDETLGALTDLVRAGKIRAFGTSKQPPSRLVEARALAERRGHGFFRTEEVPYSMINRAVEYDLLPTCQRLGTGVLAFGVLGGGWLSGRYQDASTVRGAASPVRARRSRMDAGDPANAAKLAAVQALGQIAQKAGLSLVQLATAFVLRHPGVTSAVIGPRTLDHLEGYLAADGIRLGDDVLDRVDAVVAPAVSIDVADTMWQHGTRALQAARRRR
ncbi:MAG TPA: aldo/keto reductase [Streptosporangiaceae bacterium]|jgi:aryl-alcohol dehydrogenase-like predicted oxidoreductase|nr:aldo/keto reductase [Streptosporangiaceae bacterium]